MNMQFKLPVANYNFEAAGEVKVQVLREVKPRMCDTPEKINEYIHDEVTQSHRHTWDKENFVVLFLDARRNVIGFEIIATGILDAVLVHPREVFRPAITMNAQAIVIAHNHPGGDPAPSTADIRITRDLIRAGQLLKIELLDHVIYTMSKSHASLKALGQFYT